MAEELMDVLNEIDELDDLDELGEDTQKGKFMTFRIGEECYGIAINYVSEIISAQTITPVPEVEDYIKGLINIRGKIIPVIDVKSTTVGLVVEQIADVITVDEKSIIPPPSLNQNSYGRDRYVFGLVRVSDEVKLLLDPEKLIRDEDPTMPE